MSTETQLPATGCQLPAEREVVRCRHCALNQFAGAAGTCRRCRKTLAEPKPALAQKDTAEGGCATGRELQPAPVRPRPFITYNTLQTTRDGRRGRRTQEQRSRESTLGDAMADTFFLLRSAHGMSQQGLARKMRRARTYLTKIEHGKVSPNLHGIERFAQALQIPTLVVIQIAEARARSLAGGVE